MNIFNSLVEIQPTLVVTSGVFSEEQYALSMVEGMIKQIPAEFGEFAFRKKYDLSDPVNTVLLHQILLFNNLLGVMKKSLLILQDAPKGLIVALCDSSSRFIVDEALPGSLSRNESLESTHSNSKPDTTTLYTATALFIH